MKKRQYYSVRRGTNPLSTAIDLNTLKTLFLTRYERWENDGYFQQHFGYWCVDNGDVPGNLGADLGAALLFYVRKADLWPIRTRIEFYSEDDLFDMLEFLHDHISKPVDGYHHTYSSCGYHYHTFDEAAGRREYREVLADLLESYGNGFEFSDEGELMELAPLGTAPLLTANIPSADLNVTERVSQAIAKFRRYRSSVAERRDAIRDLADVLEYLRPQAKSVLTKADEGDLFNIANNFGIRHHNHEQKTDYDQAIWLSWMFYFYLATIHACTRMLEKAP